MAVPVAAAVTTKIAIAPAQISSFLRKVAKKGRNQNDETRMTKLEGMTNDQMTNNCDDASSSFGCRHSPHLQLREEKRVNVRQLLNALAQRSANSMTGTGTRPQENWIVGLVRFLQARRHLTRVIRRDPPVVCAGHHQDGGIFRLIDNVMIG